MKSRLKHFALIVLGFLALALPLLSQAVPKYASLVGGLVLLVADWRKALGAVDVAKPIMGLFVLMLLGHALCAGCATFGQALSTCSATATQAEKVLEALGSSTIADVAVAAVDALKYGCAAGAEVDAYIEAHQSDGGAAVLAESDPLDAVRYANARVWRNRHPK